MRFRPPIRIPATVLVTVGLLLAPTIRAEVVFDGLDEVQERNARALVTLANAACEVPDWRLERLYRAAPGQLRDALEALGHYRADIRVELDRERDTCWRATFTVDVGAPTRIDSVDLVIDGPAADDAALRERIARRQPVVGEVLDHGRYEAWKRAVRAALRGRGYFDAELTRSEVRVAESLETARIELAIDSGPRYRFGEVTVTGSELRPELLRGFLDIRADQPYDESLIARANEDLRRSGYFGGVSIDADPAAGDQLAVPITIELTPGKRHFYNAGIGFSTDVGVQAQLGYTNRRMSERGDQFQARLYASEVDSEATVLYRWPRGDPRVEWYETYGGYQLRRTDTSESDKTTLGIRRVRERWDDWLETPYLNYTVEDFEVGDQVDDITLLMPGVTWEQVRGRAVSRISSGHRYTLNLRGASDAILSDTSFLQARADARWIVSTGTAFRLVARLSLATTWVDEVSDLPATVRFFAGGDQSVRGYDFESQGPTDDEGQVIGGSRLAVASLTLDRRVRERWAVAAFVDSGNAFNDSDFDPVTGIGLGVRWYSPVGPIRFDVAHPLDGDEDFRIHVAIGPEL